ncbi:MAG: hypothetical protein H8K03_17450 [Nitrospira sp.]
MLLQALANPSLPKLAWVAEVDRTKDVVTLQHGSGVEVRSTFFIEGVWNGPFEEGDFSDTDCVFGTGGILGEESIRFVTSACTTDYLFYADTPGLVTVSNSLPLLLGSIGDALDPRYLGYPEICDSIMEGINRYRRDIPTQRGMVRRQMYRNLDVSREKVFETEKRMPPRFRSFKEYRSYLQENYALIAANARDPQRTHPLEIWSTQSKGYDTTAVNAIARTYGIDKVFTVTKAKQVGVLAHQDEGELPDDDGGEICESLGLSCIRLNRRAFTEEFDQEYLYYCGLHHNQDANLKDISKHISKVGVLLTGTHGTIWYTKTCLGKRAHLDSELRKWDMGGHGMAELRLVAGFIHVPLPFIGARRKEDIVEITESSEMNPWRLGNAYDRPIARRIAEEAGVPRHAFGQSKMGSVVLFPGPSVPYGRALRIEFFNYLANEKIMMRSAAWFWPLVRWVNTVLMMKSRRRYAAVYYVERVIAKLTGRDFRFRQWWREHEGSLFCFCVNRTARTYAEHLQQ